MFSFIELAERTGISIARHSFKGFEERGSDGGGARPYAAEQSALQSNEEGLLDIGRIYQMKDEGGAFRGIYQKETETALNVGGLAKTLRRMSPGLTEEAAKTLADGILAKNGISVSSGAIGSLVYQLVMSEALETNPGQHGISVVGDNYQQF